MKKKRKEKEDRNYLEMVEEMAELVDEGMNLNKALEKIKKKHKLNEKEEKELRDIYVEYCHEKREVDELEEEAVQEPDEDDDFFGEDIDFDDSQEE